MVAMGGVVVCGVSTARGGVGGVSVVWTLLYGRVARRYGGLPGVCDVWTPDQLCVFHAALPVGDSIAVDSLYFIREFVSVGVGSRVNGVWTACGMCCADSCGVGVSPVLLTESDVQCVLPGFMCGTVVCVSGGRVASSGSVTACALCVWMVQTQCVVVSVGVVHTIVCVWDAGCVYGFDGSHSPIHTAGGRFA